MPDTEEPCTVCASSARDVPKEERRTTAQAAITKVWDRRCVRTQEIPEERGEEVAKHNARGTIAHIGGAFDRCMRRKNHLPREKPRQMFEGRAVYSGNNMKDHGEKWAIFQDL